MQSHLVKEIKRIDLIEGENSHSGFPEFMRRVRMTMIPSIGYFLVVPKVGPKWQHFKTQMADQCQSEGSHLDE